MMTKAKHSPCSLKGPMCEALKRSMGSRALQWQINISSGKITETILLLRSGEFSKTGIVLNFCPFCGKRIYSSRQGRGRKVG